METNKRDVELTVDVVVEINHFGERPEVVLIKRTKPPFEDKYVLPGGHVETSDRSLAHAAARELYEETGIMVNPLALTYLCHLDRPDRDPRGRKVSVVFTIAIDSRAFEAARAGSDAAEVIKMSLARINKNDLGFDHHLAIEALRNNKERERWSNRD